MYLLFCIQQDRKELCIRFLTLFDNHWYIFKIAEKWLTEEKFSKLTKKFLPRYQHTTWHKNLLYSLMAELKERRPNAVTDLLT